MGGKKGGRALQWRLCDLEAGILVPALPPASPAPPPRAGISQLRPLSLSHEGRIQAVLSSMGCALKSSMKSTWLITQHGEGSAKCC